MAHITEIRAEVAEIKKMVPELYDRLVIPKPLIETGMLVVRVPNIWAISDTI